MILVDIDGTLAATGEILQTRYNIPLAEYPAPFPKEFWESPKGLEVFRDADPIEKSVEALQMMKSEIVYITIRPTISGFISVRWLEKHGYPNGSVCFCQDLHQKNKLAQKLKPVAVFEDDPEAPKIYSNIPVFIIKHPYNTSCTIRYTWEQILQEGIRCIKKPF